MEFKETLLNETLNEEKASQSFKNPLIDSFCPKIFLGTLRNIMKHLTTKAFK